MSFIRLPEKQETEGYTREMLDDAENRWGYIPNICRAYSLAPQIIAAEDDWHRAVMYEGLLPRKLKEAVATVVSVTNHCNYCASSHAYAYTIAGGDADEAEACKLLNLGSFDSRERAALEFTRKATHDPKSVTAKDMNRLKEHFTDPEIIEIATVIQLFMGYNWFVTILGLELEAANPMGAIGEL